MRPGYQEQILYILNKHHSIVTVELGDAVTDDILQLIDSAKREGAIEEMKMLQQKAEFMEQVGMNFKPAAHAHNRLIMLEQSEESI